MKRLSIYIVLLVGLIGTLKCQELLTKQQVLEKMTLANNYFLGKWPDPTKSIVTNKTRPSNLWTRGTYFEGLMQLFYINNDSKLYKYAVDWGTFHKWQPTYTGFTPTRIADNQCCFQTYIELYQIDSRPERIATLKLSIDDMVNSTKVDDWWWIDAMHMAMPVFTKLGNVTGDNKYYEKLYDLYNHTKNLEGGIGLYNPSDSLWYRDKAYLPPTTSPNGLPVYWSRGNGWVFAALTRTLDVLPIDAPHREEYLATFKEMASKLIKIQRADGFWNCNLGDPADFGGKEMSGTVFFTYGLAWGINHSILDSTTYFPVVVNAWNGLINSALHADGSIGYVQSAGSKPADGQPLSFDKMPDFDDFALGGFLLAGSEMYRLVHDENQNTDVKDVDQRHLRIVAYPNPFSDFITLKFASTESDSEIQIVNICGECIYKTIVKANCNEFVWNGKSKYNQKLSNAVYFISLKSRDVKQTVKVVLVN